ncbi:MULTISPECIES: DUF2627 domain-containing protein [Aneurinibacillus]|uniref:DUF2627 domain-containing protein n=1 Tax=Aneurinibacillus thermoaerophilus TaxID=143495 RepID=A0A1G7XQH6_ANETH|nr:MULTISPECIES: DUF2627 domain-containing protein [Aneurinibacillus]AMA73692.1 hypothetical protein ACH33_13040 [Aneurinibacillus sp. XH2]MED0677413.1 DUF2627 domain-containing protein [Aneurinibacillus thermoaerophilus]MED0679502.1 DUF2627 domain-containing protein [Aneurinibacillus thermoaerophilus]MED0737927.1 DUF2627 domain-containing protein [Aneurinibacillus thermoaerophilus]MED0756349.1 DUF2627 domain-containing protein [Aneurinibacillus thermoaerophilus]
MFLRFVAVFIVYIIPGAVAAYGFKMMRDTLYLYFDPAIHTFLIGKFMLGFVLFVLGIAFIGGFILHTDRKKNLVQPRFRKKEQP